MARYNLTDNIIAYEEGKLDERKTLRLFSHLVKTGLAWTLQGHYGRQAVALIEQGLLRPNGVIPRGVLNDVPE